MRLFKTLKRKVDLTHDSIDLPTNALIEDILLYFNITLKSTAQETIDIEKILEKIRINIKKDSDIILSNLTAFNHVIENYILHGTINPDTKVKTVKDDDKILNIPIVISGGHSGFQAYRYDSLALDIDVKEKISENTEISNIDVAISIIGTHPQDRRAFLDWTVKSQKAEFNIQDYDEILKLPKGNAIQKGFLIFRDSNGVRTDDIIQKIGLASAGMEEIEVINSFDYASYKAMQTMSTDRSVKGVVVYDYRIITEDTYGLKSWRLKDKENMKIKAKTKAPGTLEYIQFEHIVDTTIIDQDVMW